MLSVLTAHNACGNFLSIVQQSSLEGLDLAVWIKYWQNGILFDSRIVPFVKAFLLIHRISKLWGT